MYPLQVEASIESLLARQQQLQGKREQLCRTITLNSRAPKADWQGNFAWDMEVDHLLHSAFALANFRSASTASAISNLYSALPVFVGNSTACRPDADQQTGCNACGFLAAILRLTQAVLNTLSVVLQLT